MDEIASNPRLMRRSEAANFITEKYFPCAVQTLAKLATLGMGPPFRKVGIWPLYDEAGLDGWAKSRLGPYRVSSKPEPETIAA